MQINEILARMVEKCASDLHLMVNSPPVFRIYGVLTPQEDLLPLTDNDIERLMKQVSSEKQRTIFERDLEADFAYSVSGLARFRVNVLKQRGTMSLVFRRVSFDLPSIDELELPQICKELILKPRGLVLVTGSSGSGKSTTLAAMINYLNSTEKRNVVTIEDPIEFLFPNKQCLIRQRDLGDDTRSFSVALRHALRHDPDVIVVGEMRDMATITAAIRAAESGHLVLSTLHSIDAPQSTDRIIDMFPPNQQQQIRLQLSQVLEATLSQTLLPRISGGRIAAFEIMLCSPIIRELIRAAKIYDISTHMEICNIDGMQTLDQALAGLVRKGIVRLEDALVKSSNPATLKKLLTAKVSVF